MLIFRFGPIEASPKNERDTLFRVIPLVQNKLPLNIAVWSKMIKARLQSNALTLLG